MAVHTVMLGKVVFDDAFLLISSDDVESYHSWSDNGRWTVFSSRRMDGLYTRPYLVYVDAEGRLKQIQITIILSDSY